MNAIWRRRHGDEGVGSLIGLLVVLLVLGVMGVVVVGGLGGLGVTTSVQGTPTSEPVVSGVSGVLVATLRATCVADYTELSTALQVYETLHSSAPSAGTQWVAGVASGQTIMESWPVSPGHFSFSWNGTSLRVRPHEGPVAVNSAGSSNPPSGCDANLGGSSTS